MSSITNQKILHIVNDNSAAAILAGAQLPGEILPWQDALYEGPVVAFKEIDKLAKYRAQYFAARGFGQFKDIENAYLQRNAQLKQYNNYTKVILWFDHDLFGQLQLVQLIDWFYHQEMGNVELCQVNIENLKSGRKVLRISQLSPVQVTALYQSCHEVTLTQANICRLAWDAFTSTTPHKLISFQPKDLSTMPFLKNAIARLIQEYPSKTTGLSRTEYLIIDAVAKKMFNEDAIFNYMQLKEPVAFMSKTIFLHHLNHLMNAKYPMLVKNAITQETALETSIGQIDVKENPIVHSYKITVTKYTNQVIAKWLDWVQLNGINRWIGGVHLSDGNIWRYDSVIRKVNKTYV